MGLLTTTIGSFPKPRELRLARWKFAEEEIDGSALREAEDRATREVVRMQESLGLDLLVDGEMDRSDLLGFFAERIEGMELAGLVRCWGNRYYRKPMIEDAVSRGGPLIVDRWTAAQALTERPLKAVLTGPYTLMHWSFDDHYGSRGDCCRALAAVLRDEVRDLVAAGAREIQIDEPALGSRPEEMELACEALTTLTEPARGESRLWLHVCYGDPRPLVAALPALPVDGLLLEMANSGHAPADVLAGFPEDRLLGAGVIDVVSEVVEEATDLRRLVEEVLRVVPLERLSLAPDAGLRGLSEVGARAKLERLVEVAGLY
jgi:5-methyltetrahydropteroyltriglutamate--homocysteine methyltransferase